MKCLLHVLAASCLASSPCAADQVYLTDLVGGLTLQASKSDSEHMSAPSGALRIDFGRELGAGFWLLGSLSWSPADWEGPATSSQDQALDDEEDASKADKSKDQALLEPASYRVDSLLAAATFRYTLPIPQFEMYVQMGPGVVFDLMDRPDGFDGRKQAVMAMGLGLGFETFEDVYAGFRADTLFGSERNEMSLGAYVGIRFSSKE
jgi:hypothetical protein